MSDSVSPQAIDGNDTKQGGVNVRPMTKEDAPAVARIWAEGLTQTADSAFILFRPGIRKLMEKYGEDATSPTGDVGPEGCNLLKNWKGEDRVMLVSFLEEDPATVVGCVGVKVGSDYQATQPDSKEGSIWRMSVDPTARRQGIGKALMIHAEEWAVNNGCTSAKLVTANSIAAKFYCYKMGYQLEPVEEKPRLRERIRTIGLPKPLWYHKSLVEEERLSNDESSEVQPSDDQPNKVQPSEVPPSEVPPSEVPPSEVQPSDDQQSDDQAIEVQRSEDQPSQVQPGENSV